jgi:[NiFe] hydrogenase assembly HybE family chaperone
MTAEADAAAAEIGEALARLWRGIAPRMADLPIYNPALEVAATPFRRHGAWAVGVVVTPWFMNLVAVPDDPSALPAPGAETTLDLPCGEIGAVAAALEGFGRFASASLFSPMDRFADAEAARAVAEAALGAVFGDEAVQRDAAFAAPMDRRRMLFGQRNGGTTR